MSKLRPNVGHRIIGARKFIVSILLLMTSTIYLIMVSTSSRRFLATEPLQENEMIAQKVVPHASATVTKEEPEHIEEKQNSSTKVEEEPPQETAASPAVDASIKKNLRTSNDVLAEDINPEEKPSGPKLISFDETVLSCPFNKVYRSDDEGGLIYWKVWNKDTPKWIAPYKVKPRKEGERQYITFEPDEGGWNNIRMALVTGRTLVLPDEYGIYLLGKRGEKHDFDDFYNIQPMSEYFDIIQMQDFLKMEGLTGQLKGGERPPGNQTTFEKKLPLWQYIRRVAKLFPGDPEKDVLVFGHEGEELDSNAKGFETFLSNRRALHYDEAFGSEKVIHFTSSMDQGTRYLAHFYGFYYFTDENMDRFIKRFIRDYLHYNNDITCYASRVVDLIRKDALERSAGKSSEYYAIHIRRNDFQYKDAWQAVDVIFANVEDVIPPGSFVYVLTDEVDDTYFDPVRSKYHLRFLKDYQEAAELHLISPNYSGMIEQMIAVGSKDFVGTYYSTLTAFITRMRGYHGRNPGYYSMPFAKNYLQEHLGEKNYENYYPVPPAFFIRDYRAVFEWINEEVVEEK